MKKVVIRRRKAKFINKQRHKGSCGPVAVANVVKWCGLDLSYDRALKYCIQLRAYNFRTGMWPYQLKYVLQSLQLKFRVRKSFTRDDLDALLDSGGCCIFVYDTPRGGHAVFIDARNANGYRTWNRGPGFYPWFTRAEMKKAIKDSTRKRGGLYVYTFQRVKGQKK